MCYPGVCLKGKRKTTRNLSGLRVEEYEAGVPDRDVS
jgi:hypothetical protein